MYNTMYILVLFRSGKECAVAQMIRKQIYLERTQQLLLTQLAKARGVSEAEVIRQAIEHEATAGHAQSVVPDTTALDEIVQFALGRARLVLPANLCAGIAKMRMRSGLSAMDSRVVTRRKD